MHTPQVTVEEHPLPDEKEQVMVIKGLLAWLRAQQVSTYYDTPDMERDVLGPDPSEMERSIFNECLEHLVALDYGQWVEDVSAPKDLPSFYILRPIAMSAKELVALIRASHEMK